MPKTSAPPTSDSRFRIGDARVQPDRLVVCVDGVEHAIEPRVMEVLLMLAEHAGETVSAEQFLIQLWRGTFYGDNPVHKAITALRSVFGDSPRAPRYIETIRKRGYRLIAPIVYPGDYRRIALKTGEWTSGSPFVGLSAFDGAHAGVFCGRSRTTAELLGAMRRQIELQRRFVLVVGASGCGKTSLLQAGALPMLQQDGGFDGLQTLSYAHCDLAGVEPADATSVLASALAQWRLGEREVFPPQSSADLVAQWKTNPARIAADIEEAFRRHPSRDLAERPHAHLLLCIDHAESLVSGPAVDADAIRVFDDLLRRLCETPRTLVAMIVRGDFYLKLVETLPDIAERKGGDGHVDVLTPRPGEIADIIRRPAALAGLAYEQDAHTSLHLDDVLRDAAAAQPDALPLLQHTLQALYERRDPGGRLLFSAYHAIGGLEGALAHRAEEVFATLPDTAQRSLDAVLSQMVVVQPENDSISARRIVLSTLDADARQLAETFVRARLFVAELDDGAPIVRVAHEALLRQWPRARDWAQDNRRILQARVRLQRAAARWVEEGKRDDHLLNPGRPLGEALEAAKAHEGQLATAEKDLLAASKKKQRRRRATAFALAGTLVTLTLVSLATTIVSIHARNEAEAQRRTSQRLSKNVLVDLYKLMKPIGKLKLLDVIANEAIASIHEHEQQYSTPENILTLSRALRIAAEVKIENGDHALAETALLDASSNIARALNSKPNNMELLEENGYIEFNLGYLYNKKNNFRESEIHWKIYLSNSKKMSALEPNDPRWIMETSYATDCLGTLLQDIGKKGEAIAMFRQSATLKRKAIAGNTNNSDWQKDLMDTLSKITSIEESIGHLQNAIESDRLMRDEAKNLLTIEPESAQLKHWLANAEVREAMLLMKMSKSHNAIPLLDEAISTLEKLCSTDPSNTNWKRDLVLAKMRRGEALIFSGNVHAAVSDLQTAKNWLSGIITRDSPKEWNRLLAMIDMDLAITVQGNNRKIAMNDAIQRLSRLQEDSPNEAAGWLSLANALTKRAINSQAEKNIDSARLDCVAAVRLIEKSPASERDVTASSDIAECALILGRYEDATKERQRLSLLGYSRPWPSAIRSH